MSAKSPASTFENIKVDVPEGESGDWAVRRFTVTEEDSKKERVREIISGFPFSTPPGLYTGLYHRGRQVVSDVPSDITEHLEFIRRAKGRVLLNGLGLGVVLRLILKKSNVKSVDVVEKSSDIIKLVAPFVVDPRVRVHHGNAFTYTFPEKMRWDVVWHDIWDYITESNLEDMDLLKRRFLKKCRWQGCWGQERCKYHRKLWA